MTRAPQGFTFYFAMLVASLALGVGLAIYDLTVRELDLSSTATQSQYAVYAADTAAECALYWDAKGPNLGGVTSAFGTSSTATWASSNVYCGQNSSGVSLDISTLPPPSGDQSRYPECSGNGGTTWCVSKGSNAATTTFSMTFYPQQYCAVVQVTKFTNGSGVLFTTVNSRGYNTCVNGSLRVERTLQVTY